MVITRNLKSKLLIFSFLMPALILYTTFFIFPSVSSIYYSFTSWSGLEKHMQFIGLDNYAKLLTDERVFASIKNTFVFTIIITLVQNLGALLLAVALDMKLKTKNIIRTVFFIPSIMAPLAVGFIWSYLYNPYDGLINQLLGKIGLSFLANDWLGNTSLVIPSVIMVVLWQCTGYAMVIYLAGLQTIPVEYYEASMIDGAKPWQRFVKIIFPLIAPSFTTNVLLSVIGCLKTFDIVYSMTMGGPGYASETIATVIFANAFGTTNEFAYGTTIAVVLFIMIFLVSLVLVKFLREREIEL